MSNSFSNPVAEATADVVKAIQKAQVTTLAAGFELAAELLERQRVATIALLDAFAAAASSHKN